MFPPALSMAHFDALMHIVFHHVTPETVSPSFSLSLSVSLLYLLSFCKPHTRDGVMIQDPLGFKGDAGSGTLRVASDASSLMFSILQVRGTENAVFLSP